MKVWLELKLLPRLIVYCFLVKSLFCRKDGGGGGGTVARAPG